jgi:hypothetical protein
MCGKNTANRCGLFAGVRRMPGPVWLLLVLILPLTRRCTAVKSPVQLSAPRSAPPPAPSRPPAKPPVRWWGVQSTRAASRTTPQTTDFSHIRVGEDGWTSYPSMTERFFSASSRICVAHRTVKTLQATQGRKRLERCSTHLVCPQADGLETPGPVFSLAVQGRQETPTAGGGDCRSNVCEDSPDAGSDRLNRSLG